MSTKRGSSASAVLGWDLVAVGGFDGTVFHETVEAYDTRAGKWRMLGSMVDPRAYGCVENLDGKLYAMGGMCSAVSRPAALVLVGVSGHACLRRSRLLGGLCVCGARAREGMREASQENKQRSECGALAMATLTSTLSLSNIGTRADSRACSALHKALALPSDHCTSW